MVPWDIPGVTGTPISGGRTSRIFTTSVSGHMGSIQLPWHSGMLGTSRKSKTDLQLGVLEACDGTKETHKVNYSQGNVISLQKDGEKGFSALLNEKNNKDSSE